MDTHRVQFVRTSTSVSPLTNTPLPALSSAMVYSPFKTVTRARVVVVAYQKCIVFGMAGEPTAKRGGGALKKAEG